VSTGDAWLAAEIAPLLRLPKSVVFIVFDEGTGDEHGGGHVLALALGTSVRRRSEFTKTTDHHGLLRTIESAWHLPLLTHSAGARAISGIWS
jgi:hypothetical protein